MTPKIIASRRLTSCRVVNDGGAVRLEFLGSDGQPVAVEFPFDQAESIVMTLPQVLSKALQQRTDDRSSRYVFPPGRWSIESSNAESLIVALCTDDGFEVSFAIPFDACRAIGQVLTYVGEAGMEQEGQRQSPHEPQLLN